MTLLSRLFPKRPQKGSAIEPLIARPDADARALLSQGESAYRAQQWASAREKLERAAALEPRSAQAHYLLGALALRDGDLATGVDSLRRAVALQPDKVEYHYSLASTLLSNGRREDAIDSYRAAVSLNPGALDWRIELAAVLAECDRIDEAVAAFRPAGHPGDAAELYDLGSALQERKRLQAAAAAFRESARLQPDAAATHLMLAACLRDIGMVVEAESPAREATRTGPDMPEGWFMLGNVLARQARHEEAVEQYRKAIELVPDYDAPWRSMLFAMNYSQRWTAREVYEAHLESARRFPEIPVPAITSSHRQPGHRLRLGYLSGDFCRHPVAYFIEPVLQHHNRGKFEVFCYHTLSQEDDVTARLKSQAEHWRATGELSEEALEQALRADDLDILVELSGHSDGHRLAVVARRVAPVQVSYLGYPNTTGLAAVDYRITDARADPPGESDALHVEELVRLPETFLCYAPPFSGDFALVPPMLERGHVTFGSFNNFAKLSPKNIALWARVLAAVPGSKLFIKAQGLQDAGLCQLVFDRFRGAGIVSDRLELAPPTPTIEEHMQSYARVDIALDTFPYHGTTTTMDALWMGVPVVTLEGDRHASRVSASILSTLSLQELVARSPEEYVEIARKLARDPDRVQALRGSLRERLRSSPLMNGERFTRHLEEAYLRMWQRALRRPAPRQSAEASAAPMTSELLLSVQGGAKICAPSTLTNITTYVLLEQENWFEDELSFVRACVSPGQCVVDVGANLGVFTTALASSAGLKGKVLAFEPAETTVALLRRTLKVNGLLQAEVIQAALSDRRGEALLEIGDSPELNALTEAPTAGRRTERVEALLLDDVLGESGVEEVAFLKIDAEGHEVQVGWGARQTLQRHEPLVLFEIKHGQSVERKLRDYLRTLGFESYRLLPGLSLLVPFAENEALDAFQLNLFACTPARAQSLRDSGLLIRQRATADAALSDYEEAREYLQTLPGSSGFCVADATYGTALQHYAFLQTAPLEPEEEVAHLAQAARLAEDACRERPSVARLLTYTRLCAEAGRRAAAVAALARLKGMMGAGARMTLDEPCLPPHARYARLTPGSDSTEWVQCAVVETFERLCAFSSVFQGPGALTALEYLRPRRYYCAEMERRRQLLRMRSGKQQGPEPHPLLEKAAEDNLNRWFWAAD